jgi:glutamyl-tRNA synthetase
MNGIYVRELSDDELTARLETYTGRSGLGPAVAISREKIQTLKDFWPLAGFFFDGPAEIEDKTRAKWLDDEHTALLANARAALGDVSDWNLESIERALTSVVQSGGVKPKDVYQPIRVALTGTTISPGIFETLEVLGRDESLARIDAVLG